MDAERHPVTGAPMCCCLGGREKCNHHAPTVTEPDYDLDRLPGGREAWVGESDITTVTEPDHAPDSINVAGHLYVHVGTCPCPQIQAEVERLAAQRMGDDT